MSIYCPLFPLLSSHFSSSILSFLTTSTESPAHYLKASMASRQPRTYPSDPDCFVIWLRDEDGTRVEAFEDYDPTKILVVKCIQVVRHMLLNTEVAVAFAKIATEYSKAHPNSWYMEDSKPGVQHMVRITRDFIESIIDKFPNVFVDYSMKTPNFLGCHCRREWVDWNPRNQSIQINGMVRGQVTRSCKRLRELTKFKRTRHMVEAQARRANKGPNDPDTRDFWHFVFMFTNTILHEISHVYITFLSKGARDADTPIHMNAPVLAQAEESVGEAGRWLERKLFQGTIHYYRDPDPGKETLAHQVCSKWSLWSKITLAFQLVS